MVLQKSLTLQQKVFFPRTSCVHKDVVAALDQSDTATSFLLTYILNKQFPSVSLHGKLLFILIIMS